MSTSRSRYLSLLSPLQHKDARLYDALVALGDDVFNLIEELHPSASASSAAGGGSVAGTVTGFTATLFGNNLRLTWDTLPGIVTYEIRYRADALTDWDTASSILHTSTTSADINPLTIPLVYGTYTFLIRASNSVGLESASTSTATVTISQIPVVAVTPSIIDNNVLLYWSTPSSIFNIAYYNVYKDSVLIGTLSGTFIAVFETVAGTFEYGVEAVDIVGNVGTRGTTTATVNQPPDYELRDVRISTLNGTRVNTFVEGGMLLACVNITETYQQHFVTNGWDGP